MPPVDTESNPIYTHLRVDVNGLQVDVPVIASVSNEPGLPVMVPLDAVCVLPAVAVILHAVVKILLTTCNVPAELI